MSITAETSRIAIIGASGFLGRHLLGALLDDSEVAEVRVLVHVTKLDVATSSKLTLVQGDLDTGEGLDVLIGQGWTVVNLAWLSSAGENENVLAARRLAQQIVAAGASRLIHCSTAVVAGSAVDNPVNEETNCVPYSSYQKIKLSVERELQDNIELVPLVIIRPTAIFGDGGRNLVKMLHDIRRRPSLVNWLHCCIGGGRTLNLVPIETVVAAIRYLSLSVKQTGVFIVACDDSPFNTYRQAEKVLREELKIRPYKLSPPELSLTLFSLCLRILGRGQLPPARRYAARRLADTRFVTPVAFETALRDYARKIILGNGS